MKSHCWIPFDYVSHRRDRSGSCWLICLVPLHPEIENVEQPQNCDPAFWPLRAILSAIVLPHIGHVGAAGTDAGAGICGGAASSPDCTPRINSASAGPSTNSICGFCRAKATASCVNRPDVTTMPRFAFSLTTTPRSSRTMVTPTEHAGHWCRWRTNGTSSKCRGTSLSELTPCFSPTP